MTKQEIFDQYAEELGYESFEALIEDFQDIRFSSDELMKHIFNATDLVCKQALENVSERIKRKKKPLSDKMSNFLFVKSFLNKSITNSENIPK